MLECTETVILYKFTAIFYLELFLQNCSAKSFFMFKISKKNSAK